MNRTDLLVQSINLVANATCLMKPFRLKDAGIVFDNQRFKLVGHDMDSVEQFVTSK